MLYFFLSYAREDDPAFVRRFFKDLSHDVRNLAGADRMGQVGFLDEQSIQPGQRWAAEVDDALATCRSFVALTSPRYFRRDYCGREWWVFKQRLQVYEQQWSRPAPALLPINWIPAIPMHPVAAGIQRPGLEVGGRPYNDYGLRQLLYLKRFRHEYRVFVFDLARKIVAISRDHTVPRPRNNIALRPFRHRRRLPGRDGHHPPQARLPRSRPARLVAVLADRGGATRPDATRIAIDRRFDCEVADVTLLQSRVAAALPNNLRRRDAVMLRQNVPTHDQFSTSLEEILDVAQNRILRTGTVSSRVPGAPTRSRPILEGPTSTTDGPDR